MKANIFLMNPLLQKPWSFSCPSYSSLDCRNEKQHQRFGYKEELLLGDDDFSNHDLPKTGLISMNWSNVWITNSMCTQDKRIGL